MALKVSLRLWERARSGEADRERVKERNSERKIQPQRFGEGAFSGLPLSDLRVRFENAITARRKSLATVGDRMGNFFGANGSRPWGKRG